MMSIDEKKIQEQLDDLEMHGELPPIALQATGKMFYQHAELMVKNSQELQSILFNDPDLTSWPRGSWDSKSYELQEYGSKSVAEKEKSDPIHELTVLRKEMDCLTQELKETNKRLMMYSVFEEKKRMDVKDYERIVNRGEKRQKTEHRL